MTAHSFKEGDRVRLTTSGRAAVVARIAEDPEGVPSYALNNGTVVPLPVLDPADIMLRLYLVAPDAPDLFLVADGSTEGADNPLVAYSDEYELVPAELAE